MLRIYAPFVLLIVFIAWMSYHAFFKKDLKFQLNNVYAGLSFVGIWAVIYYALLK